MGTSPPAWEAGPASQQSHAVFQVSKFVKATRPMGYKGWQMEQIDEKHAHFKTAHILSTQETVVAEQ